MGSADEACFIRMVMQKLNRDVYVGFFKKNTCTGNRHLPHAASAEAASEHNAFGIPPGLLTQVSLNDVVQLLGERLDGRLDHGRGVSIALGEHVIQLLLADLLAGFVAQGVVPVLTQNRAHVIENGTERALASLVADE